MIMGFSEEWDQRYIENTHMSVWPWSDVVSLVRRYCKRLDENTSVLELGCGAGANIPFFQSLAVQYHAVEGSPSMVVRLHHRFPDLAARIVVGDFTNRIPFQLKFDLVVDRAALTHNDAAAIKEGLLLAWNAMSPGALFIGVDWFSTRFGEYGGGEPTPDPYTRADYRTGPFAGTGKVHFSDESHLRELLSQFEILFLEEKCSRCVVPHDVNQFASWNFVVRKRNV